MRSFTLVFTDRTGLCFYGPEAYCTYAAHHDNNLQPLNKLLNITDAYHCLKSLSFNPIIWFLSSKSEIYEPKLKFTRALFLYLNNNQDSPQDIHLLGGGLEDIGISSVSDGEHRHPVEFTAGGTKVNIVARVVMHTSLGKHGIVLNLRLADGRAVVADNHQLSLQKTAKEERLNKESKVWLFGGGRLHAIFGIRVSDVEK